MDDVVLHATSTIAPSSIAAAGFATIATTALPTATDATATSSSTSITTASDPSTAVAAATIAAAATGSTPLATTSAPIWEEVRGWRSITFDVKNPAHRTMMNLGRLVDAVNEEMLEDGFVDLARVISGGQIKVMLPESETDSFRFAGRVLGMSVDFRNVEPPAEIRWNESAGVLVITGNTTIRDATVSIDGFSIQKITPERVFTRESPKIEMEPFIAMTGREELSISLHTLKKQLDMLKVPVRSQARVLQELCNTGQCNAMFIRAGADG